MANDLINLDMRLKRRGPKGSQHYQHQLPQLPPYVYPKRDYSACAQSTKKWEYTTFGRSELRRLHKNSDQSLRYPWRGKTSTKV